MLGVVDQQIDPVCQTEGGLVVLAETIGPVRAFTLPSFTFRPLLEEHFEVADKVIVRLCQRLRAAQQPITP